MEKCHVIFPGKFKPVHAGHIAMMHKYLDSKKYDVDLTIVISCIPKEGISPESSKAFLDKVFAKNRKVHIVIAKNNSPIIEVYDMIGQKVFGDGIYAMGTSSKGTDIKRSDEIIRKFGKDGKYYTPGVTVIRFPVDTEPISYVGRKDAYANGEISSTILRNDLRNNDYANFKTAYTQLINNKEISEADIRNYFETLSKEILPVKSKNKKMYDSLTESYWTEVNDCLFEGGAAGHMDHPYDVESFTFKDLKELVNDLFAGNITDVTEKLDGQNLFASVDNNGNTIFARNEKHLFSSPWYLKDIENNPKWIGKPTVQHAFTNAAITIDKVFKNLNDPINFFNYDDMADGVRYRNWVNLEIIDTQNFNVIPYVESKISFHNIKTTCFDYADENAFSMSDNEQKHEIIDDANNEADMQKLQKAINKTNRTAFKAQITPNVVFKHIENGKKKAQKYIDLIDKIEARFNLYDDTTIAEYKRDALSKYLKDTRLAYVDGKLKDALLDRWLNDGKKTKVKDICEDNTLENGRHVNPHEVKEISDFDKEDLPLVIKKIMSPFDKMFIVLGNEVLKSVSGLTNAGHETEVTSKLKKEMKDIEDAVKNSDDAKSKIKLEQSLKRLAAVNSELNSTEGIVFKYKGHMLKLTGSFAPLNQIFGSKVNGVKVK